MEGNRDLYRLTISVPPKIPLRSCFKSGLLPPGFVETILKSSSTAVPTPVSKSFLSRQNSKSLSLKQALRWEKDAEVRKAIFTREEFFQWCAGRFQGIAGIHEGSCLAGDYNPAEEVFDTVQAPLDRDWVSKVESFESLIYFNNFEFAQRASRVLRKIPGINVLSIESVQERDWNLEWKKHFVSMKKGLKVDPFWKIFPVFEKQPELKVTRYRRRSLNSFYLIKIWIRPGTGFGTGTHETTQICLRALGELFQESQCEQAWPVRVLDFGSGSGILSIASAVLGAKVCAVEIDPLAISNAKDNYILNSVQSRIIQITHLQDLLSETDLLDFRSSKDKMSKEQSRPQTQYFDVILANILKSVHLEFSTHLVSLLAENGKLILSGVLEPDLKEVLKVFSRLFRKLKNCEITKRIYIQGDWRGILICKKEFL